MLNLILPVLLIGFLFFRNLKAKKSMILPSSIVITLFFLSILLAYPYMLIYDETVILNGQYLESSIVFCFLLLLYLIPFLHFREDLVNTIVLPNKSFLYTFSVLVCLLSLFSLIYFTSSSIKALTTTDIGEARIAMVRGDELLVSKTIFNTIAGTAASFYQIPIILFFIYEILNERKVLKWLLFISSFSYVLFVLSAFGRDGVLFWFLSFIGIMGFFYLFLSKVFKRKLKIILFIFAIVGVLIFMIISFSRFGDDTFNAMISYLGQSFTNFSLAYNIHAPLSNGDVFPLFRLFLGLSEEVDSDFQSYILELGGTYSYVFGTFLNSFILSLGFFGTLILGIVFYLLFKSTVRTKIFSVANLFVYFLYFQVFYQGVFYFRQYNRVGNLVIIVSFILYFIFFSKIKYGKDNMKITKLKE